MNIRSIIASAVGVVAVVAVAGGAYALITNLPRLEEQVATTVSIVDTTTPSPTPSPTPSLTSTPVEQVSTPTPSPSVTQAPPTTQKKQNPAPATKAPIRCPAGSSANSNDGVNDTSCYPVICFSIAVPDPAHPECDKPFKP
ncbi:MULTISPECIES: hypothetical protein [Microbacterium]|jgi:hypothetical protein|uniref:hypothetical protein n=1 Tax=Microbacterium TaxID=33882 RepID=UPI000B24F21A|nr:MULTISPECIES: hypothetical protein [unclassified Microbacterium]